MCPRPAALRRALQPRLPGTAPPEVSPRTLARANAKPTRGPSAGAGYPAISQATALGST